MPELLSVEALEWMKEQGVCEGGPRDQDGADQAGQETVRRGIGSNEGCQGNLAP